MSRAGNPYDHAAMESVIGKLKSEVLGGKVPTTHAAARAQLFADLECWHNQRGRHNALLYKWHVAFEARFPNN